MLVKYIIDKVDDVNVVKFRVEYIVYDLGDEEYDFDQFCNNFFEEFVLVVVW